MSTLQPSSSYEPHGFSCIEKEIEYQNWTQLETTCKYRVCVEISMRWRQFERNVVFSHSSTADDEDRLFNPFATPPSKRYHRWKPITRQTLISIRSNSSARWLLACYIQWTDRRPYIFLQCCFPAARQSDLIETLRRTSSVFRLFRESFDFIATLRNDITIQIRADPLVRDKLEPFFSSFSKSAQCLTCRWLKETKFNSRYESMKSKRKTVCIAAGGDIFVHNIPTV